MIKAEELKYIVDNGNDIIPFLKTLTKKEGKGLLPTLAQLRDKYGKSIDRNSGDEGYGPNGNLIYPYIHIQNIYLAGVVCASTATEFRNNITGMIPTIITSDIVIKNILPWHVPNWINQQLNNREVARWILDYDKIMNLKILGYFNPTEATIARVFERSAVKNKLNNASEQKINFELLDKYPEALDQHFWYLFEYETDIDRSGPNSWAYYIPHLIQKAIIPRDRVIKACLLSCTKGINRTLTAWFYKLLLKLDLNVQDLVNMQTELITCLYSQESSAIKYTLKAIIPILDHSDFRPTPFIEASSVLLNSPTKSIVSLTLKTLEKIGFKHSNCIDQIVNSTTIALSHQDPGIQLQAAKYLKKNAIKCDSFKDSISMFLSRLSFDARELMRDFIDEKAFISTDTIKDDPIKRIPILDNQNKIPSYNTYEDIVFFLTQVRENNEHWHSEQILKILPTLDNYITKYNAIQLSQIYTHALGFILTQPQFAPSTFIQIYMFVINEFANKVDQKYPGLLKKRINTLKELDSINLPISPRFMTLEHRKISNIPAERMVVKRAIKALNIWRKGHSITLLSLPTHLPSWIHPEILIDRILDFETNSVALDILDWQMAVMRLSPEYQPNLEFEQCINNIQCSPIKYALLYFYKLISLPQLTSNNIDYFYPAIISIGNKEDRQKLIDFNPRNIKLAIHDFQWKSGKLKYLRYNYDRELQTSSYVEDFKQALFVDQIITKSIKKDRTSQIKPKELNINQNANNQAEVVLNLSFFDLFNFTESKPETNVNTYYNSLIPSSDAKKYLSIAPNNKHLFLSKVLHSKMKQSNYGNDEDKNFVVEILEYLLQDWFKKEEHEITYAFLAASILAQDKIARQLVSELWIVAVDHDIFNSKCLGRISGILLCNQYAPLKRLTDIISTNMINLSKRHDLALIELLQSIIPELPDSPITNTKKILELYTNLHMTYMCNLPVNLKEKLKVWDTTKSLQKAIKNLLK